MMNSSLLSARLPLFPSTTRVVKTSHQVQLSINGCDLVQLADQHGTPLYLYDRFTLQEALDSYRQALKNYYPAGSGITYAGKAFLCTAIAQWAGMNDLFIDCTGAGEIGIAVHGGLKRENILVHGVSKSAADLTAALSYAGTVVVDHLSELHRIYDLVHPTPPSEATSQSNSDYQTADPLTPELWLRLRPGLAVATHVYTQTGQEDSKFGMSLEEASQAVGYCLEKKLPLKGVHFHLGSQFRDPAPIGVGLGTVFDWLSEIARKCGWLPSALSPGGGWGVAYHEVDLPHPPIEEYVAYVANQVVQGCQSRSIPLPCLRLEPGRSLVARAGVALYRVGAIKQTSQRRWLLLDGGMTDNPRPALYGTRYSALPVINPDRPPAGPAWLGGPYCESGDILIENIPMPDIEAGELIAIPMSGAYHISMSSNYNGTFRPEVLWLEAGNARLIQHRETLGDLIRRDEGILEN